MPPRPEVLVRFEEFRTSQGSTGGRSVDSHKFPNIVISCYFFRRTTYQTRLPGIGGIKIQLKYQLTYVKILF